MRKLKKKKEKIGIVISNKMKKTIIISETKRIKHPYYKKVILKKKNIMFMMNIIFQMKVI